jgi:hypothetical protein
MGHEHSILSDLIGIALIIFGCYHFAQGMKKGLGFGNTLDNFHLFTMQDTVQSVPQVPTVASVKVTSPSPSPKPKVKQEYNQLHQDCFDALKAIGVRTAKERKYLVNSIFNNHSPSTVQEFLQLALSK